MTPSAVRRPRWLPAACTLAGILVGVALAVPLMSSARASKPIVPSAANAKKNVVPSVLPAGGGAASGSTTSLEYMVCRGPFRFSAGTNSVIEANPSAEAAGFNGQHLAPGTCAPRDRGMSNSESARIRFPFGEHPESVSASGVIATLSMCAVAQSCVVKLWANPYGVGEWRGDETVHVHRFGAGAPGVD